MNEFLRRVVGLHWSDRPYRAVVWVGLGDQMGIEAITQGLLHPICQEADGCLARITAGGLDRIGQQLPFRVHGDAA